MGLLLTCAREVLPGDAGAFLICTHELTVSAVSEAGEPIFGQEVTLVGADLLDLVTSPVGDDQLTRHARMAAQSSCAPVVMPLRLRGTPAGYLILGACAPGRRAAWAPSRPGSPPAARPGLH